MTKEDVVRMYRSERDWFELRDSGKKAEAWKTLQILFDKTTQREIADFAVCTLCRDVLSCHYSAGTRHLKAHAETCVRKTGLSPGQSTLEQCAVLVSGGRAEDGSPDSKKRRILLTTEEIKRVKSSEVSFVVQGRHSMRSVHNPGLHQLLQNMVDIAARRGWFEVTDVLASRKAVAAHLAYAVAHCKNVVKEAISEPMHARAFCLSTDLWTENYSRRSFLAVHAFGSPGTFH